MAQSKFLQLLIEIERIFDVFNDECCEGKLVKPLILLSPSNGQPMTGWFGVTGWKQGKDELQEINLCAEFLHRDPYAIIETLLHEMAHLYNYQHGVVDIDTNTQYHFETFKTTAIKFGLKVRKGKKGYAYTCLGPLSLEIIEKCDIKLCLFGIYYR